MKRTDFRFFDRLRVRWAEVDMQGIVFNAHYLMYIDTAVAAYWRGLAMPYHATMAQLGGDLYVRKATLEYLGSARYDDLLHTGLRCERIGNSSILFVAAVFRGEVALVTAELVYVFANPATQTSQPVPQPLRDTFLGYEAGMPVVTITLGDWPTLQQLAQPLRQAVFVQELGIPTALEADAADHGALHAVAHNRFGAVVATGRLTAPLVGLGEIGQIGQIGRMAVLQSVRGSGVGRVLLDALLSDARQRGLREVMLHAQLTALPFYARAGFVPRGPVFEAAGLAHQTMVLVLQPPAVTNTST